MGKTGRPMLQLLSSTVKKKCAVSKELLHNNTFMSQRKTLRRGQIIVFSYEYLVSLSIFFGSVVLYFQRQEFDLALALLSFSCYFSRGVKEKFAIPEN